MTAEPLDDDWLEVLCDECCRTFRSAAARDQHLTEDHGFDLLV